MENMEPIESNLEYQEIKGETPSPKLKKSFNILSDKRNDFLITLETEKDLLIITACNDKFIKNYYKEKFSLQYLRNYFGQHYDIEKCSSEIITIISQKKGIIRELKSVIELIIPLNSKDHLEISFLLKKIEKSNNEKFEQLYELINDLYEEKEKQKREIDSLKKKLEGFTNQEIHIIGLDGKEYGSSIEITCFGENKFKEFTDNQLNENNIYMRALFKFDESKKDIFKKMIEKKPEVNDKTVISIRNDSVSFDTVVPLKNPELHEDADEDKSAEMLKNFLNINELFDININFKTDLLIKDILEKKNTKEIIEKFFKMKLIIKGITINSKLLIQSGLYELEKNNKIKFLKEQYFSEIFTYIKIALNNKITTLYLNEEDVNQILNIKEIEDIIKLIKLIQNELKSKKTAYNTLLNFINFEDFIFFVVIPKFKIGFKIKVILNTFNEVIKQMYEVKKKENEEKKEKTVDDDFVIINNEKEEKIDDNEMKILKKFREEFALDEKDFSNEHLIKVLRKYEYNTAKSFNSLFK